VTAFRAKGAKTFKARVYGRTGRDVIRSLGTRDEREAGRMEAMLATLRERRRWDALDAIIARELTVPAVFDAYSDGTLQALLDQRAADAAARAAEVADVDLEPLVATWAETARSARYVRQIRGLIPAGVAYRRSAFTRKGISTFLAGLQVKGPTRNRYRVAVSQFAKWLVEREILTVNPVREVSGFREHDPRMVHYTRDQAQAIVTALPTPELQALEALMAGTGAEWGAAIGVHGRDIRWDSREVWLAGGKTRFRQRWVTFTEPWAWERFAVHAQPFRFALTQLLFPGMESRHKDVLEAHRAACVKAEAEPSTLHDWRHTYAIVSLTDGMMPQAVKRQLGHSPHSTMLERVYSAFLPQPTHYAARPAATKPATSGRAPRKRIRGEGA
jgi:integrase